MRCLVLGATGYIGSRLVPRLLERGDEVRTLVRDPARLAGREWAGRVEVVPGDAADRAVVEPACRGVDAAFYLVHSMDGPGFAGRDREAAGVFAAAAHAAGLRRIVYLGGLQPDGPASVHLRSRREVGDLLLASGVPTAVLQAGIVVGAGSASFEMVRHAATAPVLPMPDRAWNRVQPVAVDDVLHHLVASLDLPPHVSGAFDVGGPDVLTYVGLVQACAAAAGLPRPLPVPVPGAAPRLTARALAAVTAVDRHLAGPLFASMAHDLVCRTEPPTGPPPGGPTPYAEAVRRAFADRRGGKEPEELVSEQIEHVAAPPEAVWQVIRTLGGGTGWYTVPGVWALRGALDRLLGGPGARRTRPPRLTPGAALDWWRVEAVEHGRALRLRAEMRLPGTALLELRADPAEGGTRYCQRVTFRPDGALGRAYWYAQLPAHHFVFAVMARTIAGVATRSAQDRDGRTPCPDGSRSRAPDATGRTTGGRTTGRSSVPRRSGRTGA